MEKDNMYSCGICCTTYEFKNEAEMCEKHPYDEFKFKIDDNVVSNMEPFNVYEISKRRRIFCDGKHQNEYIGKSKNISDYIPSLQKNPTLRNIHISYTIRLDEYSLIKVNRENIKNLI